MNTLIRKCALGLLLGAGTLWMSSWAWAGGNNRIKDGDDQHAAGLAGYNGKEASEDCQGMARWWVSEPFITLWLEDEPLWYQPSRGPAIAFHLSYKQRNSRPNSVNVFSLGPGWECSWLSWISVEGLEVGQCVQPPNAWWNVMYEATLYLAGGGTRRYTNSDLCFPPEQQRPEYYSQTKLMPLFGSGGSFLGFEIRYPDGSRDEYKQYYESAPEQAWYLTAKIDTVGNTTQFLYDTSGGRLRLLGVQDVDSRSFSLSYGDARFPTQITQVSDPYSRSALLQYNAAGQLTNLIDPLGVFSRFSYDGQGVVTNLTTPYGVTSFKTTGGATNYLGGVNVINRSLEITTPDNARQLYVYMDDSTGFIPASYSTQKPSSSPAGGLSANDMAWRNSWYWNPRQYAALSTNVPASFTATDFRKGRLRQWLRIAPAASNWVSATLNCERAPSPDGINDGQFTYFDYYGKAHVDHEGTNGQPNAVIRVQPDGHQRYGWYRRNAAGYVTNLVETYASSLRRTNVFEYATNGIDLLRHLGPNSEVLAGYEYNAWHQVTRFTNAVNEVWTYDYDPDTRQLTAIHSPSGLTTVFAYYGLWEGDNSGRLHYLWDQEIDAARYFSYARGLIDTFTDARGLTTSHTWDDLQRLTSVRFPDGTTSSNRYDKLDLASFKDRLGAWTHYGYDAARRLQAVTNALYHVTRFTYCDCGVLENITDALTNITSFEYDLQSRRTNVVYPDGRSLQFTYDRLGLLTRVSDPSGFALTNTYNHLGLPLAANNNTGRLFSITYDKKDRPDTVTDAAGVTVTNTYDNLDRLLARHWPNNTRETFFYTANGLVAYTNRLGQRTLFGHDEAGRMTVVTNANLEEVRFTYNAAGDRVALEDGRHNYTFWGYDEYGRVRGKTNAAEALVAAYDYDANGRLTNRWTPAKGHTGYAYDVLGNLTNIHYAASPGIRFAYDALSRLTNMVDSAGTTAFGYTQAGQLQSEDGPWASDTLTYAYTNQLRTGLTLQVPGGAAWTNRLEYDATRRLKTITSPAGAFGYEYLGGAASASLLVRKLGLPNTAYLTNAYDPLGQLTNTWLKSSSGGVLSSLGYAYHPGGLRTNLTGADGTRWHFTFDALGQLTNAATVDASQVARPYQQFAYHYDAAGNLDARTRSELTQSFTLAAGNQLQSATRGTSLTVAGQVSTGAMTVTVNGQAATLYSDGMFAATGVPLADGTNTFTARAETWYRRAATNVVTAYLPETVTYEHDANGNLLSDGLRRFAYDNENQLSAVYVTNGWQAAFTYDGLGRRRLTREYAWQNGWVLTNEVRYVCDGMLVLQERDGNNAPSVNYTRGLGLGGGIGGLLARTDGAGHAYFHADGAGNVTALIDANQDIVARYLYDPYGNVLAMSGPLAEANHYRFSSKEVHPQSGLYYYGFRFYDPNLQRWLNQDPLGEAGGINLYGFVGNSPIMRVDPWGWDDLMLYNPISPEYAAEVAQTTGETVRWLWAGVREGLREDYGTAPDGTPRLGGSPPGGKLLEKGGKALCTVVQRGWSNLHRWLKARRAAKTTPKLNNAVNAVEDFLGGQGKIIKNADGDTILMRGDKKIRFDIKDPHGDKPHFHLEQQTPSGKWKDAGPDHRYYFKED